MPVRSLRADELPAPGPKVTISDKELEKANEEQKLKAKYKIEIMFSKHRSPKAHVHSPFMMIIWESGKRFHGGGDQKMYWCGYDDCGKPMSSDVFAYMHCVCPSCHKEMFLDPDSKQSHVAALHADGRDARKIQAMPFVVGEKLGNLIPMKLAGLIEKTWRQLDGDADIYLKYSPYEIRYDILHETPEDVDNLTKVRVQRKPLIYLLKSILKDLSAGADLRKRILAMITS
jgi:hypothetical protein